MIGFIQKEDIPPVFYDKVLVWVLILENDEEKKKQPVSCSDNSLIFSLGWIFLVGERWKIDFLLIS